MFGSGKKKKTRTKSYCTTKLFATRSTRVVEKVVELCHIVENRLLAKQLPLLQKGVVGPSLAGSSSPIISWYVPRHQTNCNIIFSFTTSININNNSYQNPTTRVVGGRDGTQWNLRQLRSMGIELARKRNNNNNAFEEFFFCTQVIGAAFNPFAICWKKYMKMLKAPLHLS